MSEQWYCRVHGPVKSPVWLPEVPRFGCDQCHGNVTQDTPPFVLTMQERISTLEKVAEEAEYMAKRTGATQALVRELRAAGYLKEQGE